MSSGRPVEVHGRDMCPPHLLTRLAGWCLLVLALSVQSNGALETPTTNGRYFLFSFQPKDRIQLHVVSKEIGNTTYTIECLRNCPDDYSSINNQVTYPGISGASFSSPNPAFSGKTTPVMRLTANADVSVWLFSFRNHLSMDATLLFPQGASGQEYLYVSPPSYASLLLISYNNTETNAVITLKNNELYIGKDATNSYTSTREVEPLAFQYAYTTPTTDRVNIYGRSAIKLQAFESYYLHAVVSSDMTGMHIMSDNPIVVLQGSDDVMPHGERNSGVTLDSVSSVDTLGRFYVVPSIIGDLERAELKVVSAGDNNPVSVQAGQGVHTALLESKSDWFYFMVPSFPSQVVFVSAVRAVLVVKIIYQWESLNSSPCMMTIPSVDQWSDMYRWWNVPESGFPDMQGNFTDIEPAGMKSYAVIASLDTFHTSVMLDGEAIPGEDWQLWQPQMGRESEMQKYRVTSQELADGEHEVNSLIGESLVLIYSAGWESGYCAVPGRKLKMVNRQDCVRTVGKPGDLADNDCDGQIDEEAKDDVDNDGDGFIDEDVHVDGNNPGKIDVGAIKMASSTAAKSAESEAQVYHYLLALFLGMFCLG